MPSSAPAELSPLALHDALPIFARRTRRGRGCCCGDGSTPRPRAAALDRRGWRCGLRRGGRKPNRAGRPGRLAGGARRGRGHGWRRSEEHTSELQSLRHLVCRLLRPLSFPPLPYTTLFRSLLDELAEAADAVAATDPPLAHVLLRSIDEVGAADCVVVAANRTAQAALAGWLAERGVAVVTAGEDRKSTRLNSSHLGISYAVFCAR